MAALATQLEQLEVGVGDVAAVVAGENEDGDEYWLLRVTQPPRQLAAPLMVSGLQFEAGEFVVEGTWYERCRGKGAGPRDYVLGEAAAAYTHLVICTDVELHQNPTAASSSSSSSVYTVSLHEDERICAAKQALPMHLLDACLLLPHPPPSRTCCAPLPHLPAPQHPAVSSVHCQEAWLRWGTVRG